MLLLLLLSLHHTRHYNKDSEGIYAYYVETSDPWNRKEAHLLVVIALFSYGGGTSILIIIREQ